MDALYPAPEREHPGARLVQVLPPIPREKRVERPNRERIQAARTEALARRVVEVLAARPMTCLEVAAHFDIAFEAASGVIGWLGRKRWTVRHSKSGRRQVWAAKPEAERSL